MAPFSVRSREDRKLLGKLDSTVNRQGVCMGALPNQNGRDEEEASSQEEGEALHEVQSDRVEGVEDAGGHQHGQAIHTGHSREESACEGRNTPQSWKDPGASEASSTSQLCGLRWLQVSHPSPVPPTLSFEVKTQ